MQKTLIKATVVFANKNGGDLVVGACHTINGKVTVGERQKNGGNLTVVFVYKIKSSSQIRQ